MVTDTLRALLLEWCGYSTTVFEFIGGEHTAKNVMIAAIKKPRVLGPESGVGVGDAGEGDMSRNLAKAKELLASIDAADKLKKLEKKKKFRSVSVNEFGDVDVDSYDEPSTTTSVEKRHDDDNDDNDDDDNNKKSKLNDIANMITNNERVAIMEEEEESAAIARRISNMMKTFGVKNFKLFDLIFENEAEEINRNKYKTGSAGEKSHLNTDKESYEESSSSSTEGMEKNKKQLKLKKFRR